MKKLFCCSNFTPYINESFQISDHFFSLFFSKDFENPKKFDVGFWEMGAKRLFIGVRNTNTKKILLSKAIFTHKKTLFCAAI